MPKVFIPTSMRSLTGGLAELDIDGATIRQLITNIESHYPGCQDRLLDQGRLRANIAVAIDNDIKPLGLVEAVSPTSEVHFITAIRGGSGA